MSSKVTAFLDYVRRTLHAAGIELVFSTDAAEHRNYTGWYDGDVRELVVFRQGPQWLETLVHEYCHFLQHHEGHPLFEKTSQLGQLWLEECALRRSTPNQASVCKLLHSVSQSRRTQLIEQVLVDVQRLELDVAPKTETIVRQFQLPVNLELAIACVLRNVAQWRYEVTQAHQIIPRTNIRATQNEIDQATITAFGVDYTSFNVQELDAAQVLYFQRFYSRASAAD